MSEETKVEIKALAEKIYLELLSDLTQSTTIQAHREVKRNSTICGICGTFCRSSHPLSSTSTSVQKSNGEASTHAGNGGSRSSTPLSGGAGANGDSGRGGGFLVGPEKGTGGSTGIGSGSGRGEGNGNVFFDCLVCGRAVVSTKYAPHLASCLGFGGATRRGGRSAAAKVRMGNYDRSSPISWQSENGDSDVDSVNGSKNGKKSKVNANGKRGMSPSKPPIGKKHKLAATPSQRPHPPSRLGRPPSTAKSLSHTPSPSPVKSRLPNSLSGLNPQPTFSLASNETSPPSSPESKTASLVSTGLAVTGRIGEQGVSSHGYQDGNVMDSSTIAMADDEESSEGANDDY